MPDRRLPYDYSRSRAVVMGTWDYVYLQPVPAVANSLVRMSGLLTGPLCGWPRGRVLDWPNEQGPGDLLDRLVVAFEDVTDVALFYYVGHGQMDEDDQLCLGLTESRTESHRRPTTSLQFGAVRRALNRSDAAVKIVILDCCFAGLAIPRGNILAADPGSMGDLAAVRGAYTMTASGAYNTAWYETGQDAAQPQTYFTRYLADLVETGIPGQGPELRLHPLFTRLRDNLRRDGRPTPVARSADAAREFVFARNAAFQTSRDQEATPPDDLDARHARRDAWLASRNERDRRAEQEQDRSVTCYQASAADPGNFESRQDDIEVAGYPALVQESAIMPARQNLNSFEPRISMLPIFKIEANADDIVESSVEDTLDVRFMYSRQDGTRTYGYMPTAQVKWVAFGVILGIALWIFSPMPFYFSLTIIALAIAVPTAYLVFTPTWWLRTKRASQQTRRRKLRNRRKSSMRLLDAGERDEVATLLAAIDQEHADSRDATLQFAAACGTWPTRIVAKFGGHYDTITAAIAASGVGDCILIRPGEYDESLVIDKDIRLHGHGQPGQIVLRSADSPAITIRGGNGVITNLTIRQTATRGTEPSGEEDTAAFCVEGGEPLIQDCDISSDVGRGIMIVGSANPGIRGNRIHDSKRSGVLVRSQGRGTFEDNDITANASAGIGVESGGDPVVRSNRIYKGHQFGVLVRAHGRGTFEDNDITGNTFSGIGIESGGDPVVRGNRIRNCLGHGVYVYKKGRGTFEDNDITANTFSGVKIESGGDPVVRSNRIRENGSGGISVSWTGRGTITGNILRSNKPNDLKISPMSGAKQSGNRITSTESDL